MKTACPCLTGLAALVVALTVATAPADPAKDKAKDTKAPVEKAPPRDLKSPYANSAIGAVIDANDGKVPATGAQLVAALEKLGDFVQLPVPFSAVALDSGLTHPRVVMTMRPSTTPPPKVEFIPDGKTTKQAQSTFIGGWGFGGPSGTTRLVPQPPEPLNLISVNRTQLQGRLFLAANTEVSGGELKVRTVEFISWNSHKLKFEFGMIEGMGTKAPELKFLDGARCFSCHKNKGPILGADPWSNTAHNDVVRKTALDALSQPRKQLDGTTAAAVFGTDGIRFHDPHAPEVDAAVRIGGDLVRDRALFKRLVETSDGRKALLLMFDAILTKGPLEKNDKAIHPGLNALPLGRFVRDALNAKQNAPPSLLRDFSPAGSVAKEIVGVGPGGYVRNQVAKYDDLRALGQSRLPSEYQPSNPKAFVKPQIKNVQQTSEVYNAVLLAQTIGLTEKDRDFLSNALDEAEKRLKTPALTRVSITNQVLTGPTFTELMATGVLPDRDDFKDRFVAGIVAVFKGQGRTDNFWVARDTYASTPLFDPNAKPEKEIAVLPSHACLRCHDVLGTGKAAFNPIPPLAFDPFDATARAEWLKNADRKSRTEILARLQKRLGTDKDMPPDDSIEAELYRSKDAAGMNAVKGWLDAELKKVK